VPHGTPNSRAAGANLLIGEDSIDFDITLQFVDPSAQVATILVQHVPPAKPQVNLPAPWMREPVEKAPNNWVEGGKDDVGRYAASVGKQTVEDRITVSLVDGRMLSATIGQPGECIRTRMQRFLSHRLRISRALSDPAGD
jgi:hypothetical protein